MSGWEYTIRIGYGQRAEGHEPTCVYVVTDDLDDTRQPLLEGIADDVQDAITKVAAGILNVEDDKDAAR